MYFEHLNFLGTLLIAIIWFVITSFLIKKYHLALFQIYISYLSLLYLQMKLKCLYEYLHVGG